MAVLEAPLIQGELCFASAGCTRHPQALITLPSHDTAAYISHNNIFVLNTTTYSVTNALPIKSAPLNSLKSLLHNGKPYLFTSSSEGHIIICNLSSERPTALSLQSSHQIHTTACLAFDVATLPTSSSPVFLASVCDAVLITTLFASPAEDSPKEVARYNFPVASDGPLFLPHALALHVFSAETVFLAVAGTDRRIYLFNASPTGDLTLLTRIPAHRDWIRSLAFTCNAASEPILASSSSDATVRLFRLHEPTEAEPPQPLHLQFSISETIWSVQSFALLDEHSAAVHTVTFSEPSEHETVQMLTASLDGTLAIWTLSDNRPTCTARFGLLGGHSVHATGFFSAAFSKSPVSTTVLAANFSGAIHRWAALDGTDSFSSLPAVGGHFAPISHLAWSPDGSFLLSASTDKTVRVFADAGDHFVEWGRPQVHGHAVFTVGFCKSDGSRYVSGSEERMLRVFDAPESFRLPGHVANENGTSAAIPIALAATLPELGLSNKAVFETLSAKESKKPEEGECNTTNEDKVDDMNIVAIGSARGEDSRPLEEELKQRTLWPETAKLYGHGNELARISTHSESETIASACRAQTAKDAIIVIWDARTGTERCRLPAHDLTITDLRFSPDGLKLLSVSRDRSFAVFQRHGTTGDKRFDFGLVTRVRTAHSRIIYGGAWVNHEILATGGRDKWLKFFSVASCDNAESSSEILKRKFETGVTALDCITLEHDSKIALAVGLESGDYYVLKAHANAALDWELEVVFQAGETMRCGGRVTCIQWRPRHESSRDSQSVTQKDLAVGSDDQSVRVISFEF